MNFVISKSHYGMPQHVINKYGQVAVTLKKKKLILKVIFFISKGMTRGQTYNQLSRNNINMCCASGPEGLRKPVSKTHFTFSLSFSTCSAA